MLEKDYGFVVVSADGSSRAYRPNGEPLPVGEVTGPLQVIEVRAEPSQVENIRAWPISEEK